MLRLAVAPSGASAGNFCQSTSSIVIACRRCLQSMTSPSTLPSRRLVTIASIGGPQNGRQLRLTSKPSSPSLMLLPMTRYYATALDTVRAWFTEGPEAVAPSQALTNSQLDSAGLAASSAAPPPPTFFVDDSDASIEELVEGSSADVLASSLIEPTFSSLGLGTSFSPVSLQLKLLETLHVTLDTPWWLCAILMGISVRLVILLPNMYMQRVMRVDSPRFIRIVNFFERVRFFSRSGNMQETLRLQQEALDEFPEIFEEKKLKRNRNRMLYIFASNFFVMSFAQIASIRAIYRAAELPVESFQQGGLLWLTDLTSIDPYFILPAAITGLLMLNVHQFFKNMLPASQTSMAQLKPLAYTLLPACAFTFLINFPGANLLYFFATGCTANLLHQLNKTATAKAFWKAKIGLPPVEEVSFNSAQINNAAMDRIRNQIMPAVNNDGYRAARMTDQTDQVPKTFRIRQRSQPQQQQQSRRQSQSSRKII